MKRTAAAGSVGLVVVFGLLGCSPGGGSWPTAMPDFVFKEVPLLESASEEYGQLELLTYASMSHRLGLPEGDLSEAQSGGWTIVSICADGDDLSDVVHLRAGVIPTEYVDETVMEAAEAGELLPVDCEPDWQVFPSQ
ncbi:hypothetical protein [Agrococcus casei]|uniref:hypothetical protein n=1 Tax=Agrococcus casei TaxID=343512 RepID=UPI0011786079|nr:hypothetical protein [Agrococcus casei]